MSRRQILETALARFAEPSQRDRYFELYAEKVQLHGYGVEPGIDNVRRYYAGIWTAFPDVRVDAEEMIEANDRLIVRFVLRGTHSGPFLHMQGTGLTFAVPGMTILRFEGNQCVERWSLVDRLALLTQLGAIAPPG